MHKWLDSVRRYRYYRNYPLLASIINFIVIQILVLIAGYLWFVQRTKIPLLSLILTLIIMSLLTLALLLQERKTFQIKKAETRRRVGRNFLKKRIKQYNEDEFKWQVTQLLLKIKEISDLQEREYFFEINLRGRQTAVGIYHSDCQDEVPSSILGDFLNQAALEGYTQALFITSGTYPDSCYILADKKNSMKIQLLNLDDLLDQMEHADMFPDDSTIDALIDKEIQNRKNKLQLLKKYVLTPRHISTYLAYALLFFALSGLLKNISLYYTVISVFFLALSILTWLLNKKNQAVPTKGNLLPDPPTAGNHRGS